MPAMGLRTMSTRIARPPRSESGSQCRPTCDEPGPLQPGRMHESVRRSRGNLDEPFLYFVALISVNIDLVESSSLSQIVAYSAGPTYRTSW